MDIDVSPLVAVPYGAEEFSAVEKQINQTRRSARIAAS
jgi:hypothetical protein